jgi:hypothetical protein
VQQLAPQVHQRRGAAGRHVEPPEELLPGRFRGGLQARQVRRRRIAAVDIGSLADRVGGGREIQRKEVEELLARRRVERMPPGESFARERRARDFAALAKQRFA